MAAQDPLKKLASLSPGIDAYTDAGAAKKATLHSAGKSFLRRLADDLGMPAGSFDIRSNKGGIAVSGEVTLHGDSLYVQLSENCIGRGAVNVMYRTCRDRQDCCGGQNNFIDASTLQAGAYAGFVAKCKTLMESAPAVHATAHASARP